MTARIVVAGRIETGQGIGAGFTRTDWAFAMFRDTYGVDPYPGTLNLRAAPGAATEEWQRAVRGGRLFPAPSPDWCDARCLAGTLRRGGRAAPVVAVVPLVPGYPRDQIELVAAVGLRRELGLADGDVVTVELHD